VIQLAYSSLDFYTGNWWWYILYVSNWKPGNGAHDAALGQFWSLAVEEQFYIVWPSVVLFLSRRHLAWLCGLLIVLAFTLRCIWAAEGEYWNVIYRLTVTRFDTIALGALVALAMRAPRWRQLLDGWAVRVALLAGACFCGIAFFARSISWTTKPIQTVGSLSAAVGMAGLIAYCAVSQRGVVIRVLRSRFLTAYGRYSYGMYVYHPLLLTLASIPELRLLRHTRPSLALLVAVPLFLLGQLLVFWFARFSWIHFESPILRYKARFTEPRLSAAGDRSERAAGPRLP
jgi:peptidoglycan/LPS O-acetylase OafA/YrhL